MSVSMEDWPSVRSGKWNVAQARETYGPIAFNDYPSDFTTMQKIVWLEQRIAVTGGFNEGSIKRSGAIIRKFADDLVSLYRIENIAASEEDARQKVLGFLNLCSANVLDASEWTPEFFKWYRKGRGEGIMAI